MRELRLTPTIYSYNLLVECTNNCLAGDPALTAQLLQGTYRSAKAIEDESKSKREKDLDKDAKKAYDVNVVSSSLPREGKVKSDSLNAEGQEDIENNSVSDVVVLDKKSLKAVRKEASQKEADAKLVVLPNLLGLRLLPGTAVGLSSLDKAEDR